MGNICRSPTAHGVFQALVEHAKLVADAIAGHRQAKRRAAVQETGCQSPEAAVAEPGIDLVRV